MGVVFIRYIKLYAFMYSAFSLLLAICVNVFPNVVEANPKLFGDDTS